MFRTKVQSIVKEASRHPSAGLRSNARHATEMMMILLRSGTTCRSKTVARWSTWFGKIYKSHVRLHPVFYLLCTILPQNRRPLLTYRCNWQTTHANSLLSPCRNTNDSKAGGRWVYNYRRRRALSIGCGWCEPDHSSGRLRLLVCTAKRKSSTFTQHNKCSLISQYSRFPRKSMTVVNTVVLVK